MSDKDQNQNQTPEVQEQQEEPQKEPVNQVEQETPIVPSSAEMMKEIAELKANNMKLKSSLDKTASEAGDLRKQLRARQTADEVEAEEKAKAEEARQNHIAELERRLNHNDAVKRYMSLGMNEEMADTVATAELDGDKNTVRDMLRRFMDAEKEAVREEVKKELLAQMPAPVSGNGDGQIDYQKQAIDALAAGDTRGFLAAQIASMQEAK
jgi:hypothetical protein